MMSEHSNGFLGMIQSKGDPNLLSGKMIAYARIEQDLGGNSSPLDDMIRGGILSVSGNYQEQRSLKDFLKKEFRGSFEEGLEGLISQLGEVSDLPEGMNADSLKNKLESFTNMEMIPVPAQVVFFESEESLLAEDADIFFLGNFKGASQAHLMATSFPIIYQAIFREQEAKRLQLEIDEMLGQVEKQTQSISEMDPEIAVFSKNYQSYGNDLELFLIKEVLPKLIYSAEDTNEFEKMYRGFLKFMEGYSVPEDLKRIELELKKISQGTFKTPQVLELLCQKISALQNEEFGRLKQINEELAKF